MQTLLSFLTTYFVHMPMVESTKISCNMPGENICEHRKADSKQFSVSVITNKQKRALA